jgi:hypothetical protein
MREAGLAGTKPWAAADDRRCRRTVMRCAKRRITDERVVRVNEPGNGVDPCDLERVLLFQRRENARQASRQHRLADSRWTAEQDVVPARRRKLERSPRTLLPPDIREIVGPPPRLSIPRNELRRLELAAEICDCVGKMPHTDRLDPGECGLRARLVRTDEAFDASASSALGYSKRTAHSTEASIQGELAAGRMLREAVSRDLPRGRKQRKRDRKVETRALLLQLGRSKVDRRGVSRPFELRRFDAASNPLFGLLTRAVDETDDRERRHAALDVRLDLDPPRLEADEGKRDCARKHASTLGDEVTCLCGRSVLKLPNQMMGAALVAAISLLSAGSGSALLQSSPSRVLWQGPVLAGDAVSWAEESGGTGSLRLWTARRGDRIVYRSDSLALGRPFAASRTLLAFERSYPSCPPPPGHVCPDGADAVIGPLAGPYRILVRPRTCFLPMIGNALALDGGIAAYLELDCTRQRLRVVVRDVAHDRPARVLHDAPLSGGCCRDIAIAGRYVAWSDGSGVVVYDRLAERRTYRARIGSSGIHVGFGFDLQRDGKVAVAFPLRELARAGPMAIAWLSPSAPLLHLLPFHGSDTNIRMVGDRIAFHRFVNQKRSSLVVADLQRRARTFARFAHPTRLRSLDFDGRRLSWASDRITSRRVDCPPPGEGRPCARRESGVTSIWLRPVASTRARLIAQLRFADTFAR